MPEERRRIVQAGYDRMAGRYAAWSAKIDDEARHRMVDRFSGQLEDGARVLDLGCGSGVPSALHLARRFRVLGIDASAAQIDLARRNVPGAEFRIGDFTEVDLPEESFDGTIALYSIPHVPREEHAELFANVYRWLRPAGIFLASLGADDSPDWTGTWLGERMFFSSFGAGRNRRLLRDAGFEVEVAEIAVTHEPEGDVRFLWVIARKPARRHSTRTPHHASGVSGGPV